MVGSLEENAASGNNELRKSEGYGVAGCRVSAALPRPARLYSDRVGLVTRLAQRAS